MMTDERITELWDAHVQNWKLTRDFEMNLLSTLLPGLMGQAPRAKRYVGELSGGASELYGTCKAVVWQVVADRKSFTVADVVKATGLNRVRVNRVLYRLSAEGKVRAKEKSINRYTQPTIWEVVNEQTD